MKKIKINNFFLIKFPDYSSFKFILIIYLLLAKGALHAAEWTRDYGVGATINYVDNIALAGSGLEQSDTVMETRPYISAQAEGGRTNFDLYYQLQALNYSKNNDANTIYHQLFADMKAELLENLFFLDLQATNSQSIISTSGNLPVGNIPISRNRTDVATYSVSPYISRKLSGTVNLLLRATFSKTFYDDNFVQNIGSEVDNKNYNFSMNNANSSNIIGWKIDANRSEFSTNIIDKNYYAVESLTLSYNRSKKLEPYATVGYEDNSIYQSTLSSGGSFWEVGMEWNPTQRTSISAARGKKFYGDSNKFSWSTQGRSLQLVVDYNESVTTSSSLFSRQNLGQVQKAENSNELIDITDTAFISKRYTSRIKYKKSKTTIAWELFSEDRRIISSDELQRYKGTSVIFSLRVASRTTLKMNASWYKNKSQTQQSNNIVGFSLNAVRNISKKITSSIGYKYRNNEVEAPITGYTQNIVFVNVNAKFK